eukprot:3932521-Rhodomonas_salina.1
MQRSGKRAGCWRRAVIWGWGGGVDHRISESAPALTSFVCLVLCVPTAFLVVYLSACVRGRRAEDACAITPSAPAQLVQRISAWKSPTACDSGQHALRLRSNPADPASLAYVAPFLPSPSVHDVRWAFGFVVRVSGCPAWCCLGSLPQGHRS